MITRSSTRRGVRHPVAALSLGLTFIAGLATADVADAADLAGGDAGRGEYLATIMVCGDCHSGRRPDGEIDPSFYLAGGTAGFEIPGLGVFWPPNLTPDMATGLGDWSAEEIAAAIREGVRPDGRILAPIMPYGFYGRLTDTDVADLVAYLRSLEPVTYAVPVPVGTTAAAAPFYAVVVPASLP
jgi:mono/diheme cytochrome c family protein